MKTAEEIEKEILQELFDNGDTVDYDFERLCKRREGIISERIKEYASQSLPTDERENVKHFLLWYNTSIRERYFDDEHINYVLDEYFKSPRDKKIPTKD